MYVYALHCARSLGVLASLLVLVACSNGRGAVDAEPPPGQQQEAFTVGGTISGLAGSGLVLQLNGGSDLAPVANGSFTFTSTLANSAAYTVTVLSQPTVPAQSCTVTNASGSISAANVSNVQVACTTGAFAIRGTVSGLVGTGLVLQNNGGDDLAITTDGPFGFATPVSAGSDYSVSVLTPPSNPSQSCTVARGAGRVGSADVTDVAVTCVTGTFTVGGTVTGLAGSNLVLQNNDGDNLTITGNGTFTFATALAPGAMYSVRVLTHPSNPPQSCTVTNGSGAIANSNVTNVTVACATNQFTIGGTVTGYTGSGLVLRLNNGNDLTLLNTSSSFSFTRALPSGADYFVTVRTQPGNPTQECTPANASGRVGTANVTNIVITCVTRSFAIGGSVSGLSGAGLVLQLNGAANLSIAANGEFTFAGVHLSGTNYAVTVAQAPSNQNCTVANGSGTVRDRDVRTVRVQCATSTFTIGGSVSGLLGGRLVLQNNGGNNLEVTSNGSFTFTQPLATGANYSVTVQTQPTSPAQTCSVSNGSGQVGSANVTNVAVTCNADLTIGGSVSGLAGTGLQLLNNGGDALAIQSNGSFTFATALPSGATYNVTIGAQPTGPTQDCVVTNGQGTVATGNVTSVQVTCTTAPTEFMVNVSVSGLTGSGLVLQNNGGNDLTIATDGTFAFSASVSTGSPYNVTVQTQPAGQTCTVTDGAGTVASANVTVAVSCVNDPPPPPPG
jgi:large repetitive protein